MVHDEAGEEDEAQQGQGAVVVLHEAISSKLTPTWRVSRLIVRKVLTTASTCWASMGA
jgi:hypothetical protein